MDSWTVGKYMNNMIYMTALHQRTSENESLFHLIDVWLPMWAHFTEQGYINGVYASVLTFNEQHRSKNLTVGRIEKTKTHANGIMRYQQHRSKLLEWRLKIKERAFPNPTGDFVSPLVTGGVSRDRKKMAQAAARRDK